MPKFGQTSLARKATLHPDLVRVLDLAISLPGAPDFSILCGHRDQQAQDKAVADGASKLAWPNSKHNIFPSKAVDLAPYPIDWHDRQRFLMLGGYIKGVAASMGINMRWGGDWNGNWSSKDQSFHDLPHFELLEE